MIIRLPGCYPFHVTLSLAHWHKNGTHHGLKSNPDVIAFTFVRPLANAYRLWGADIVTSFPRLLELPMSEGWRLWIYFRGGYAWHCDIYIDRRDLSAEQKIMA